MGGWSATKNDSKWPSNQEKGREEERRQGFGPVTGNVGAGSRKDQVMVFVTGGDKTSGGLLEV